MIGQWLRENWSSYFGNAAAVRDYRVQLRGNRAILIWGAYLLVLIGFTMIVYTGTSSGYETSIVVAQRRLRDFYQAIMLLLAVMINIIAPALTAGSIVMERQRRSLDLVFSAPVSAKYYLVGKTISSYRYIWMLLVLSLPVTSACVVLGGSTWSDVIASYIILSYNALVYTALALLISTLSRTPVAAVIWSYTASVAYSVLTGSIAGSSAAITAMGGSRTLEAPFIATLSPYVVVQAAPTFTTIYGYEVPNWILGGIVAILLTKFLLLGAGSAMSGFDSKETKSLRIHGLIYGFLGAALMVYGIAAPAAMISSAASASGGTASWQSTTDLIFGWSLTFLFLFLPFLTCYGGDAERRNWSDGMIQPRNMLRGTPSGGLLYTWALIGVIFAGIVFALNKLGMSPPSLAILFWSLSFWTCMWSIGRFASSFNMGLRSSRSLHFTLMMSLVALPVPFFSAMGAFSSGNAGIWDLYILRPLVGAGDHRTLSWIYGAMMIAATLILTYIAETNAARKGVLQRYTA